MTGSEISYFTTVWRPNPGITRFLLKWMTGTVSLGMSQAANNPLYLQQKLKEIWRYALIPCLPSLSVKLYHILLSGNIKWS